MLPILVKFHKMKHFVVVEGDYSFRRHLLTVVNDDETRASMRWKGSSAFADVSFLFA